MKTTHNAGWRQPGAGTLHVSASQIALLIEVAVLAMQDFNAQKAVGSAHNQYLFSLSDFESEHGRTEGRIDPLNPDHAAIIAATKGDYGCYQLAKRKAYNIQRRLQTACRKAARVNADRALEVTQ